MLVFLTPEKQHLFHGSNSFAERCLLLKPRQAKVQLCFDCEQAYCNNSFTPSHQTRFSLILNWSKCTSRAAEEHNVCVKRFETIISLKLKKKGLRGIFFLRVRALAAATIIIVGRRGASAY